MFLSPYFFPFTAIGFLLPFNVIKQEFHQPYFFILGTLVAFHLLCSIADYISQLACGRWSDINRVGRVYSTIIIIFANLVIYGTILAFVTGGIIAVKGYFTGCLDMVEGALGAIVGCLR